MLETLDDILTIPEIAEVLKIGTSQAYRLVRTGELKAFKSGKDWKISREALRQYILQKSRL